MVTTTGSIASAIGERAKRRKHKLPKIGRAVNMAMRGGRKKNKKKMARGGRKKK